MRIVYYLITTVFYYLLHPYLYFRILRKKECPLRYKEKLGTSFKVRNSGYLIWFHCSSIGELKSIFPIIDYYLKKNQILVTTSTLGSNEVFQKSITTLRILFINTHRLIVLKLLKNFLKNGVLILFFLQSLKYGQIRFFTQRITKFQ